MANKKSNKKAKKSNNKSNNKINIKINNKNKNKTKKSAKPAKPTAVSKIKTKIRKIGGAKLKMDFISSNVLNEKDERKRINYILEVVKDGTILVTDGVMTPDEELDLIRETMRRVDDGFPGIEVCSLKRETAGYQKVMERTYEQTLKVRSFFNKVRGRGPPPINLKYGITLIGPSKLIKEIKKNPDSFSVFAGT